MSFIDNILAKFLKSRYLVLLTGMTMMIGSPASAIEILKTSAAASYSFTDATGNVINSGSSTETVANLVFNVDYGPNNSLTSLATMNYHVTTRTTNDFSFFSDLICTGSCAVLVRTVLEIFVTNDGTDPANFRLDSLITPGHMGVQGLSADTRAGYNFTVTQNNDPSRAGSAVLYSASGSIGVGNLDGSSEASDGRAFNGLTKYRSGTEAAWDWSATNLNLALNTINPGETTQITYVSETFSFGAGYCTGLFYCDAAQVAFGDPRNNGGVGVNQFAALANANARGERSSGRDGRFPIVRSEHGNGEHRQPRYPAARKPEGISSISLYTRPLRRIGAGAGNMDDHDPRLRSGRWRDAPPPGPATSFPLVRRGSTAS